MSPPAPQPPRRRWLVLGRISDLGGSFFLLLLGTGAYLLGLFMNVLFVALQFVPVDDLFPPETK